MKNMLFYTVVICVLCMKEITIKAKTIYISLLIILYFYYYLRAKILCPMKIKVCQILMCEVSGI